MEIQAGQKQIFVLSYVWPRMKANDNRRISKEEYAREKATALMMQDPVRVFSQACREYYQAYVSLLKVTYIPDDVLLLSPPLSRGHCLPCTPGYRRRVRPPEDWQRFTLLMSW